MKQLAFLLIILNFFGCDKELVKSSAQITGRDIRKCGCCGGWYITIENATYRFDNLPKSSDINLDTETLPLNVSVKWKSKPDACMRDEILIERIKKE